MDARERFFSEEVRSGHTVTQQTKKVWACQLSLLEAFSDVCSRHGLRFWLDSGTLLGAVRHKGYIPWDDDIDVIMFREDYDRLLEVADSEFTAPLVFQTAYNQKHFVRGHAQLRDMRTSGIIPCEIYKDFNQGIFIDIFVMDYVPDSPEEEDRQRHLAYRLRDRLELRSRPLRYSTEKISRFYKALRYRVKYFGRKGFNRLYGRYEDIFRSNDPDRCSMVACTAWVYDCFRRDKHLYDRTVYLDFEYLSMPVPEEYDRLLTTLYGDYMKPVKAPTKHGEVIFDPDTPADRKIRELRRQACKITR